MCIIAVKMPGAEFDAVAIDRLGNCIDYNNDGAGFMWTGGGSVHIRKGYWELGEMLTDIRKRGLDAKNRLVVLHFRIATAGTICAENCHPFPLTATKDKLRATRIRTNVGIVHNGILDIDTRGRYSDTQLFIRDYLSPLGADRLRDRTIVSLLEMSGSKFAILHGDGQMLTVGEFYQEGEWYYSNTTYRPLAPTAKVFPKSVYGGLVNEDIRDIVDDPSWFRDTCTSCKEKDAMPYDAESDLEQLCADCYIGQYHPGDREI